MALPKEPRQKMINLMYLVLTALLALNVSAEILHAFHVVNTGLDQSTIAVAATNDNTFAAFNQQMQNDPTRTKPYLEKAETVKGMCDSSVSYIESLKKDIITQSGGIIDKQTGKRLDINSAPVASLLQQGDLDDDRNLEVPTHIMIKEGKASELKQHITQLHDQLLSQISDANARAQLQTQLPLQVPQDNTEGNKKSWEVTNFEMVPVIATITLLNKYQNDIRNSEDLLVQYLFKQVNSKTIVVDRMAAKVIAPSSYIMQGQDYKADIFVSAYSSTINPQVYVGSLNYDVAKKDADGNFLETTSNPVVGGGKQINVSNGMGKYDVTASGEGIQKYSGAVMVPGPDGKPRYYPFESEYQTAKGSAVISSDKLNVIYAGIPNPFSVSVPGFSADKVNASITGGNFSKTAPGKFDANVPVDFIGKSVTINVGVQMDNGSHVIGAQQYQVKRIPDPVAVINGTITQGDIPSAELKIVQGIGAVLKDFYFEGVRFDVTSFRAIYVPRRQDAQIEINNGAHFSQKVAQIIQNCRPGDQIIFDNIKARGNDNMTRSLNSIALQIK
jgi:GldM N-terminal domain/GldM C-terminal domain